MDFQQIKELIELLNNSEIGEFKLQQNDLSLSIKTKHYYDTALANKLNMQAVSFATHLPPTPLHQAPVAPPPIQAPIIAPNPNPASNAGESGNVESTAKHITIKSPMLGTFYRSASPDKPPYIKVGDEVNPGKVVCIIEAMKLFNEIESEISGRIVKVLVDDATPVEFDQPLFLVEPN